MKKRILNYTLVLLIPALLSGWAGATLLNQFSRTDSQLVPVFALLGVIVLVLVWCYIGIVILKREGISCD